jgi:hypothetical protein
LKAIQVKIASFEKSAGDLRAEIEKLSKANESLLAFLNRIKNAVIYDKKNDDLDAHLKYWIRRVNDIFAVSERNAQKETTWGGQKKYVFRCEVDEKLLIFGHIGQLRINSM